MFEVCKVEHLVGVDNFGGVSYCLYRLAQCMETEILAGDVLKLKVFAFLSQLVEERGLASS